MNELSALKLIFGRYATESEFSLYINYQGNTYEIDKHTMAIKNPVFDYKTIYDYILQASDKSHAQNEPSAVVEAVETHMKPITEEEFLEWQKEYRSRPKYKSEGLSGKDIWKQQGLKE